MKPQIFIGSSTEKLDIAYLIQENLEHDANCTVWTQGIFQLSSNAIDDLINALDNFDFAIMIFTPDDISLIRNSNYLTVRDNVIFELGLFIGKLGKEKVFFIIPQAEDNFHLPTDLTGVTGGTYNSKREDGNIKAALGPFCNQVRGQIKNHVYENLNDLINESKESKRIALEKPYCWEHLLSAELIRTRLIDINRSYSELEKGLIFQKVTSYSGNEYHKWFNDALTDFMNLTGLFTKVIVELSNSSGPKGVSGNILEIKEATDKVNLLCKELIAWEYRLQQIVPPKELHAIKDKMSGWTKIFITEINKFPSEILRIVEDSKNPVIAPDKLKINMTLKAPPGLYEIVEIFKTYFK
jgi:hypothetical protein